MGCADFGGGTHWLLWNLPSRRQVALCQFYLLSVGEAPGGSRSREGSVGYIGRFGSRQKVVYLGLSGLDSGNVRSPQGEFPARPSWRGRSFTWHCHLCAAGKCGSTGALTREFPWDRVTYGWAPMCGTPRATCPPWRSSNYGWEGVTPHPDEKSPEPTEFVCLFAASLSHGPQNWASPEAIIDSGYI